MKLGFIGHVNHRAYPSMALHFHLAQPPAALVVDRFAEVKPKKSREEIMAEFMARQRAIEEVEKLASAVRVHHSRPGKRGQRRAQFR